MNNLSSVFPIEKSWERSRQFGIDPVHAEALVLQETDLKIRREQRRPLLQATGSYLERLYEQIRQFHAMAILADQDGYILESVGDPHFMNKAQKVHLSTGANWHERWKGTNAIGTALEERRAIAVVGGEHYCESNRFLACAASPIFAPDGQLVGVLDVSSHARAYQPATLLLVDTIAHSVEDWLVLAHADKHLVISVTPRETGGKQALFAIDSDGVITGMNEMARKLFHDHGEAKVGGKIDRLFSGIHPVLSTKSAKREAEVSLGDNGKAPSWLVKAIVDHRPIAVAMKPAKQSPFKREGEAACTFADIYGSDPVFVDALNLAKRAAETDYCVLIQGESGVGKEMVSQAIHRASARADKPFVALNCGAIAKNLLESELFGYEPGAYTGAKQTGHPGKFEQAHEGTLFLDEIGEMPPEMQIALLRVLQDQVVTRVGGIGSIRVNVRIIAATHKNLWREVQAGRFRADLFYRLQGITIELPPLRQRTDRLALAERLLQQVAAEMGIPSLKLSKEAVAFIERAKWPGNVRQLLGVLRQAAFMAKSDEITVHHFPAYVFEEETAASGLLQEAEREVIERVLKKAGGNITQAARLLGIGRNTLYRKLGKSRNG